MLAIDVKELVSCILTKHAGYLNAHHVLNFVSIKNFLIRYHMKFYL